MVCVGWGTHVGVSTCVAGERDTNWEGKSFLFPKMLVVTGYSSINTVVHEEDFEKKKNSSRRYYKIFFLVHVSLSQPKKRKHWGALPSVIPLVHRSNYRNSKSVSSQDDDFLF